MSTEQLKMILDALQSLGAEGKDAFLWWLVLDKTVGPMAWLLTCCGLVLVARWIISACIAYARMDELRMEVGGEWGENGEKTLGRALEILRKQKAA